ncbi:Hsp20/alpha crystallin family protein [Cohaesibacter celericrescens]|nr:Hsp20/alpha crystallin family protein [Cohaesibacter celericrescens]
MLYQDLLPYKDDLDAPMVSLLRKQVDSLFDDFDPGFWTRNAELSVRTNLSETDKEVCITAELPGLSEEDVDVSVVGNRITIKGEKKSETDERKDEEGRQYHRIERMSGAFQRKVALPFDIPTDAVKADVKNGILTVTVAKPAEVVENTKKIKITRSE